MKKLLFLVLALIMLTSFTGCSVEDNYDATTTVKESQKEIFDTVIEIAKDIEPIDLSGVAFGEYERYPAPTDSLIYEGETGYVYYDEDSNVPYIYVQSIPDKNISFEAFCKQQVKDFGDDIYQMIDEKTCYFTCSAEDAGKFMYESVFLYDYEDMFYQVIFDYKTEEIAFSDNLYGYIPCGYTKLETAREGLILHCEYDKSYELPSFYITKDEDSYEAALLDFHHQGNLNFTQEDYENWSLDWNEENISAFLKSAGYSLNSSKTVEGKGYTVKAYSVNNDRFDNSLESILLIESGDEAYRVNCYSNLQNPTPEFLKPFINSIHTK